MKRNWLVVAAQAAFAWVALTVAASATTINPGETKFLAGGDQYTTAQVFTANPVGAERAIPAGGSILDWYYIVAVDPSAFFAVTVLPSTPGAGRGINNLAVNWFDLTTSTTLANFVVTNGSGVANAAINGVFQNLATIAGHVYRVIVTGTLRSAGGQYNLDISTPEVPLPSAMLLLISGLAGMGALSRRRKSATAA